MRATIDKAGRVVIPKPLRERLGLVPGEVEVTADGSALRVEPIVEEELDDRNGRLVIPASGEPVSADQIGSLRRDDQR
ncbi:MAG: AbrB/MazE/SpoVT family DNA-binding domain-containing protein [Microthrixaceae bacterium]